MNIVFWILVIITVVLLWFSLAPVFRKIGGIATDIVADAKNEIKGNSLDKNNDVKDDENENE